MSRVRSRSRSDMLFAKDGRGKIGKSFDRRAPTSYMLYYLFGWGQELRHWVYQLLNMSDLKKGCMHLRSSDRENSGVQVCRSLIVHSSVKGSSDEGF